MTYQYSTQGTCSRLIEIELDNGVIKSVSFTGGCHGNLQGISSLVCGMTADEGIARLGGKPSGRKDPAIPQQLKRTQKANHPKTE